MHPFATQGGRRKEGGDGTGEHAGTTITCCAKTLAHSIMLPWLIYLFWHNVFTEQRKSERKVLRTRARVAMEGEAPVGGRTSDLGANGVSINLPDPLLVGQAGQVSFDLLVDGKPVPISARAKALYCIFSGGEFKVGFQFLNLDLNAMTAIARYLR